MLKGIALTYFNLVVLFGTGECQEGGVTMSKKKMVFINEDGTITRTIPPLKISELNEDPRYRVGGDIPTDALKKGNSRDSILDEVNDLVQNIRNNNKKILEIISKSQK